MNKAIAVVLVIIILLGGFIFFMEKKTDSPVNGSTNEPTQSVANPKNSTYMIEGQSVTLVNGSAQTPSAPGSASMVTTQYFGNEATGDLNGDGLQDTAFLLTQNSGGSGTFFYAVALLNTSTGYQSTNVVLLGDRIAPQTTEIKNGEVVVNYAERKQGEPMTTAPSVGVSKYLTVAGNLLSEKK